MILIAGPLAFCGTWFVRRFWLSNTGWTGPRITRPLTTARHAIAAADSPQELSSAMLTYIADRLGRPPGALTRVEAIDALHQRGDVSGLSELDELLAKCEQATYAPFSMTNMRRLKEQALDCLTLMSQRASMRSAKKQDPNQPHALVAS